MTKTNVTQAILDSIRENRVVELTAKLDTQEWVDAAHELSLASEDYNEERTAKGLERDYWGTDDDGDAFRVRLIGE